MKLITVNDVNSKRVMNVSVCNPVEEYPDVFDGGLGTFEGEVHLHVTDDARPIVMPMSRIPLAVRKRQKTKLDRLENLGVITPVDEPTPWVSQLVVMQKKNGDLHCCISPKELNKVLLREHYTLPVLEDCLHELGQSKFFSKADLSGGFWHVQLDHE